MTLIEWLKAKKTLFILAVKHDCSMAQIRCDIQACIDEAWEHAWTPGNLQAQVNWQLVFPGGKKPTVEEFIVVIARKIKAGEEVPYLLV